jgi:glycosyltransferase involved in cell wall biosynthesis
LKPKQHPRSDEMLNSLREENVTTWFDLGLYLDRLRENRPSSACRPSADLPAFERNIAAGVAFITFDIGIDGVSMEIAKYADALRLFLGNPKIHYIAGHYEAFSDHVISSTDTWHTLPILQGFDDWPSYRDFFSRKLDRGGPLYNELIGRLWSEVLDICEKLGGIIEEHDIGLLYLVNTNSNPGNVSLALATVLVSEHLGIPVINNCHDFYWEDGASAVGREVTGTPRGLRDHFFTNSHVGEFFSVIEMLYPWESRSWVSACINEAQVDALCERFGHNPANLAEVGTAIDSHRYRILDRARTKEAWKQVVDILSDGRARLPAYAAGDVLKDGRLAAEGRRPILIAGTKQQNVDFAIANTVLLQPTRILSRKRIEVSFKLIEKLFGHANFLDAFLDHPEKKLTLVISGPVAPGHDTYLERLVLEFSNFVSRLPKAVQNRVYVAFLFSEFDHPEFRGQHSDPIGMPELYNIASLAVLPSKTEGRGLPIIESAACGVPILTRHYEPAEVFTAVIGESLAREDRLDVIIFRGSNFKDAIVERLCEQLLSPDRPEDMRSHNRRVVERRFSIHTLTLDIGQILRQLHLQIQKPNRWMKRASDAMERFAERVAVTSPELDALLETRQREYLPGFGRMGFMLMLKSLIDPSHFRIEEQHARGMAFAFAKRLMRETASSRDLDLDDFADYFNTVDCLFSVIDGENPTRVDHSLAYRHRNRLRFPYRELTPQELTGVITSIHRDVFGPLSSTAVAHDASHQVADWSTMVARCFGGGVPEIDDRDFLYERLGEDVPIAIFPGALTEHELEVFVLQTVRRRLGLGIHDEIPTKFLRRINRLAPITLIERREPLPGGVDAESLEEFLVEQADWELKLLHDSGVCRVVTSEQLSVGIDFRQLGNEAIRVLDGIRAADGFMIALCKDAAVTTDAATLDRFHIGRATDLMSANILGVALGAGYVQWAPAGLRTTLAYPTPVQTAKSLSETLHTRRFARLRKRLGDSALRKALCEDAISNGSRVDDLVERLATSKRSAPGRVDAVALNGVYDDGCPWSGVIARVPPTGKALQYEILAFNRGNQTVPEFVRRFDKAASHRAQIAWNGGYILNAELVGKLGLPESYIGSPLGLIISRDKLLSPPLFNKPAFLVGEDRKLSIRRVSCQQGLIFRAGRTTIELGPESRNLAVPGSEPCFYDLFYDAPTLPGNGRSLVRLVGNRIMEIVHTKSGEHPAVLPVGLVVSFSAKSLPNTWKVGRALTIEIAGLAGIANAVEAGPLLLAEGKIAIDMEHEGWKTRTSIQSQAARIDYLDMRGPKIAIGLDDEGTLIVLAVNGRIRESVGATHVEMAEILLARGMQSGMGFDPGGSATLVVNGETLNISPYNQDYERNVYSLPPEPRSVANVVVGSVRA